jgi:hypothetical protein
MVKITLEQKIHQQLTGSIRASHVTLVIVKKHTTPSEMPSTIQNKKKYS